MNAFRLHDPIWLLALLPMLLAVWVHHRRRSQRAAVFSSVKSLSALPTTMAQRVKRALPWVRVLGLVLVVFALARPQEGIEETRVRVDGIDIMMAIDRSGSMAAMDFVREGARITRLEAVKDVFRQFTLGEGEYEGRPDDRLGLVVFGGYAEQRCPLTLDHGALIQVLDHVEIPFAGMSPEEIRLSQRLVPDEGSTAIGDGLARAVAGLRDSDAKSRVIVLLSDGENVTGIDPQDAAQLAKDEGVRVYTIGIGSTGMAPFLQVDQFGRESLISQGVVLDEATLKQIASMTGARYFNAKDRKSLQEIVAEIDALETSEREETIYTDYRELFGNLLLPGIGLIVLELLLGALWLRALP